MPLYKLGANFQNTITTMTTITIQTIMVVFTLYNLEAKHNYNTLKLLSCRHPRQTTIRVVSVVVEVI